MTVTDLRLRADDDELWDAAADLEAVLDLDGRALDLSPAFRRLLFDLEEALIEVVLRASEARGRARRLQQESRAVQAEAAQAVRQAQRFEVR